MRATEPPLTSLGDVDVDEGQDEKEEEDECLDASLRLPTSLSVPLHWYTRMLFSYHPYQRIWQVPERIGDLRVLAFVA